MNLHRRIAKNRRAKATNHRQARTRYRLEQDAKEAAANNPQLSEPPRRDDEET